MRSLEDIKRAHRLQKLLDSPDDPPESPKKDPKPVPVEWLRDWSFWDPKQRQEIAEELLKYRGNR